MNFRFLRVLMVILVLVVFTTVYQHNMLIKASYRLQYVMHQRQLLTKRKKDLLLRYYHQRNAESVYAWAASSRGMEISPLDHLISIT